MWVLLNDTTTLRQESYSTLLIISFFCFRLFSPNKECTSATKIDLDIQDDTNRVRKMADNKSKHNSKSNLWKYFCALEKFSIPRGLDSRRGEVVKNRHLVELFYWRANVRLKVFFCLLEGKRERENFVAFIEFDKKALSDLLGLNYIYVEFAIIHWLSLAFLHLLSLVER